MSWAKLDDQFPNHPKVIAAGGDAAWLFVAGLCYCKAQVVDGIVPAEVVGRLTDRRNPAALARRLVDVGLWHVAEGGYYIHDYDKYNAPAKAIKEKQQTNRERIAKWRANKGRNGATNNVTNANGNAVTDDVANAVSTPHPITDHRSPITDHQLGLVAVRGIEVAKALDVICASTVNHGDPAIARLVELVNRSSATRKRPPAAHLGALVAKFGAVVTGWRAEGKKGVFMTPATFEKHFALIEGMVDAESEPPLPPPPARRHRALDEDEAMQRGRT